MVKYKWSLFIGALLFISCSDDEGTPASRKWPVRFSSDLSERVVSRAANGSWDAGDQVGVYMVPHVADASAAADFSVYTGAVNVPYVTSGGGTSVSLSVASGHNAIVYPAKGSQVNFVAYYPYKSDTHTANANVYKVNVSNQSSSKAIDLVYHKGVGTPYDHNTKDTDVALAFTHQLSKVKINLIPGLGVGADLSGATVTLSGFPTTADFDLSTGVLSNSGGAIPSLTPVRNGSASSANQAAFEAIVVPHSGTSYTRTVTFTIGGQAYSYTLSVSDDFKQGMAYSYIFKFMGKEVVLAGNILVDWDGGMVVWDNNDLLTATQTVFDLTARGANTLSDVPLQVNLLTTASGDMTCTTSLQGDVETADKPDWIEPRLTAGVVSDGWRLYILTFTATRHIAGESISRTGYILVRISGLTFAVTVNQISEDLYLDRVDATGEDIALPFTAGSGSFAVATNSLQTPVIRYSTDGVLANITGNPPDWFIPGDITHSDYIGKGNPDMQYAMDYSYTGNMETRDRVCYVHVIIQGDMNSALRFKVTQANYPAYIDRITPSGSYITLPSAAGSGSFSIATDLWEDPVVSFSNDRTVIDLNGKVPDWFVMGSTSVGTYTGDGKTGRLYTTTYSYLENNEKQNREFYIHFTGQGHPYDDMHYRVSQRAKPQTIVPNTTKIPDGMANCYIVVPGGEITFGVGRAYIYDEQPFFLTDALRVDPGYPYTQGFGAAVVWADADVINSLNVSGNGKGASVTVKTKGNSGNAVIKIYKAADPNKTPVWSYHIWVTDLNPYTTNKYTNSSGTIMDMNLGATDVTAETGDKTGLFYQWGRKDPFPSTGSLGTTLAGGGSIRAGSLSTGPLKYLIENPDVYLTDPGLFITHVNDWKLLWGTNDEKSIYDPCPSGWRLTYGGVFYMTQSEDDLDPWYIKCGLTPSGTIFPLTGYRDNDYELKESNDGIWFFGSGVSNDAYNQLGGVIIRKTWWMWHDVQTYRFFSSGRHQNNYSYSTDIGGLPVRCVAEWR
jgi:hypothetical protein